jgi:hypothetical protein
MQGQGFENVGDKTYLYYGSGDLRTWTNYKTPIPPRGGVGIALLPRDRFADLRVLSTGEGASELITNDIAGKSPDARRLFLNAEGVGADAFLKVELLAHDERPLKGYSGADAAMVRTSGFQVPVRWKSGAAMDGLPDRFKIKVTFDGAQKGAIRFSALYLQR